MLHTYQVFKEAEAALDRVLHRYVQFEQRPLPPEVEQRMLQYLCDE